MSILKSAGQLLLIFIVPASFLWYPIGTVPGVGNVTINDVLLAFLWVITFGYIIVKKGVVKYGRSAGKIVALALVLALLSAIGTTVFQGRIGALHEFAIFMKKFGLASVLPLAIICFYSNNLFRRLTPVLFLLLLALSIFSLFPSLQSILPVSSIDGALDRDALGERATGLISNPNDFAYISILTFVAIAFLTVSGKLRKRGAYAILSLAFIAALTNVILSGSRSGVLGIICGGIYIAAGNKINYKKKSLIILCIVVAGAFGWTLSSEFQTRMSRALVQGATDENVSSRIEAQYISILASISNPLGVGYSNFKEATEPLSQGTAIQYVEGSDSVYIDTLLGTGFLGLSILLLLLRNCWRYTLPSNNDDRSRSRLLRAGCVSVFLFGMSTIVPISVFVSPIFFLVVGLAGQFKIAPGGTNWN